MTRHHDFSARLRLKRKYRLAGFLCSCHCHSDLASQCFLSSGNKDTYIDLKKSAKRSIDLLPDQADQQGAMGKLDEIKETFRKIRVEYKEIGVAAAAGIVS